MIRSLKMIRNREMIKNLRQTRNREKTSRQAEVQAVQEEAIQRNLKKQE